jgi:DNA-binding transcriptional ArsR family regulator
MDHEGAPTGAHEDASRGDGERPPTAAEARALGHPTRLRILFACRERSMTNKELSESLGITPGTIHYHLRPLVAESFLRPEEPRKGPRGSQEQPYRATGKSWTLDSGALDPTALVQVGVQEVLKASQDDIHSLARIGLTLRSEDLDAVLEDLRDLLDRALALSKEAERLDDQEGLEQVTFFYTMHRQPGTT